MKLVERQVSSRPEVVGNCIPVGGSMEAHSADAGGRVRDNERISVCLGRLEGLLEVPSLLDGPCGS